MNVAESIEVTLSVVVNLILDEEKKFSPTVTIIMLIMGLIALKA